MVGSTVMRLSGPLEVESPAPNQTFLGGLSVGQSDSESGPRRFDSYSRSVMSKKKWLRTKFARVCWNIGDWFFGLWLKYDDRSDWIQYTLDPPIKIPGPDEVNINWEQEARTWVDENREFIKRHWDQ
jgi:hypothetical protein